MPVVHKADFLLWPRLRRCVPVTVLLDNLLLFAVFLSLLPQPPKSRLRGSASPLTDVCDHCSDMNGGQKPSMQDLQPCVLILDGELDGNNLPHRVPGWITSLLEDVGDGCSTKDDEQALRFVEKNLLTEQPSLLCTR